jgi:hypothetical protein
VGQGSVGAASAVLGFALGGWLVAFSALRTLYDALVAVPFTAPWSSLGELVGVGRWTVIAAAVALVGVVLWQARGLGDPEAIWPWWRNGVAVGVIGVAAWLAAAPAGWGYGLSMTGPTRDLVAAVISPHHAPLTWGTGLVLGIPLGSFISRRRSGRFRVVPVHLRVLAQRFVGGILMGIGGTLAAGCNIGNGLTGFSILATQSVVAMGFIALGRWAVDAAGAVWAARIAFGRRGRPALVAPASHA